MSSTFALARLAYRTAARNKLRSLLVFALIALLVAAGTTFSTIARSVIATDDDFAAATLGGADALVEIGSHIGGVVPTGRYLSTVQVAESGAVVSWGATAPIETKQVPDWLAGFDADSYASSITAEFGGVVNASRSWPGVSRWRDPQPFLGAASAPRLLLDIDMQDPMSRGIYELTSGRAPAAATEVVVASNFARNARLGIGDEVVIGDASFSVVGTAVQPAVDFYSSAVVTPAGFDRGVPDDEWITHHFRIDRPGDEVAELPRDIVRALTPADVPSSARSIVDRSSRHNGYSDSPVPDVVSTLVTAVFGIQIALVAASVFALGVRRRTVEFGQLMVVGAGSAHVRRLVVIEAIGLGVLGAVAGVVAGVLLPRWLLRSEALANIGNLYATDVRARPVDWIAPAVIGIAAAGFAAWRPARRIASVPVTTALSGRVPTQRPRARTPLWGIVAVAAGALGMIGLADGANGSYGSTYPTIVFVGYVLAMIVTFVGFLATIGTMIAVIGHGADRMPLRARLVARNSDRHRSRAWASVAAFVAVLAGPLIVSSALKAYPPNPERPDNHVAVTMSPAAGAVTDANSQARNRVFMDAFAGEVADIIGPAKRVELRGPNRWELTLSTRGVHNGPFTRPSGEFYVDSVAIATPELIEALGIAADDAAMLDEGTAIVLDRRAGPILDVVSTRTGRTSFDVVSRGSGDVVVDNPGVLLSSAGAARLGVVDDLGVLSVAETGLTIERGDQIWAAAARSWDEAVATIPWPAETALDPDGWSAIGISLPRLEVGQVDSLPSVRPRTIAIGIAAMLAAIIATMGAALAAVEVDRDIGSMIATGASPSIRRWVLGAQTAYHLGLAAIVAVPLAILLFWAGTRGDGEPPEGLTFPWTTMGIVTIVIPIAIGCLVALVFRSGKPVVSRRLT